MIFSNQDIKTYVSAEKFRLIAAGYFFYDQRRAKVYDMIAAGGRLSVRKIDAYFAARKIGASQNEIDGALDYIFKAPTPYAAGRFNDSSFPACYTGKEIRTCIEEKRHYLRNTSSKGYEYVVFSVHFSGQLVDLRRTIADLRWVMPMDHAPCRVVGEAVKKRKLEGVAAPSAREVGGSCCAIFLRSSLTPGVIVRRERMTV
jgi:hypothetical protein